jgi:uncharacterized membrane protein YqjE
MATVQTAAQSPSSTGLIESLKAYLDGWVCLLKTRVEIISTEIEEEKQHLAEIVTYAAVALLGFAFGALLLTTFLVALLWDYHLFVLGGFVFLYLGLGIGAALVVRKKMKSKPRLFTTTLAELAKDHQHLSTS